MKKPDGVELALLHALRYEEATFKTVDADNRKFKTTIFNGMRSEDY